MTVYFCKQPTRFGEVLLRADGEYLTGLFFTGQKYHPESNADWRQDPELPVLAQARDELAAYCDGDLQIFTVACRADGTPFQQRIWHALLEIPFGALTSYGALAERFGGVPYARAVGAAVGRNPLSVIVPCHRVVASNGALQGYAGGLPRKRKLLDFEAAQRPFELTGVAA